MEKSSLDRNRSRANYYTWVGVFFFFITLILCALYFATIKIDYVWRWKNLPDYFFGSYEDVDIVSLEAGEVKKITTVDDDAVVQIRTEDDKYTDTEIPGGDVWVYEGDTIYPGDILGKYKKWGTGILLQGAYLTLKISLYSIIFGIVLGLIGGVARISTNPALRWSAITYVELIRGSPLLVQIFIWYFVLATLFNELLKKYGLSQIPALWYGVAALACFTGAYVTEIVRAGIQSIHRGQIEAARSLGMTGLQALRHIILPQAIRRILPPLAGQFISLIKDSSLLGMIAIRELTKATREAITFSLQPYEFWFLCAILYLMLTFTLSMFVQYMERRLEIK
ncbi:MAG: amino acid ABC transporter permease [Desulfobacteraceae bacterium]|nr:amino acid ABC transporter permease [Desulfobacteraceae bacterium]